MPDDVKRIFSVKAYPKQIQEELIKYPEAITSDPDCLPDSELLSTNPSIREYIESSDN